MDNTWVKLYRKIRIHEVMGDTTCCQILLYLFTGVDKKTGELKLGRFAASKELNLNPNTFYKALKRLEKKYKMVTLTSNNQYTKVSLLNWAKYQPEAPVVTQSGNNQVTTKYQPSNTPIYTRHKTKNKEYIYNIYFLAWLEKFNKLFQTEYKPTKTRNELYNLRRKTFKVEEIERALVGMSKKGFYSGENDSGWKADPDFILKTDEQIDKFLNMFKGKEVNYERIDPATVKF